MSLFVFTGSSVFFLNVFNFSSREVFTAMLIYLCRNSRDKVGIWKTRVQSWDLEDKGTCDHLIDAKAAQFRLWTGLEPTTFALPVQCSSKPRESGRVWVGPLFSVDVILGSGIWIPWYSNRCPSVTINRDTMIYANTVECSDPPKLTFKYYGR